MPQHKSAERRIRIGARRATRNKARLSRIKSLVKSVRAAKGKDEAAAALKKTVRYLDQLAAMGVIHRNKAANQKSKLTKLVNRIP